LTTRAISSGPMSGNANRNGRSIECVPDTALAPYAPAARCAEAASQSPIMCWKRRSPSIKHMPLRQGYLPIGTSLAYKSKSYDE
jgi:hypothetical protein